MQSREDVGFSFNYAFLSTQNFARISQKLVEALRVNGARFFLLNRFDRNCPFFNPLRSFIDSHAD